MVIVYREGKHSDKESKTLSHYAALERTIQLHYFQKPEQVPDDHIPQGGIPWVTSVLGYQPRPDHYPEFMKDFFYRRIWKEEKWPMEKGIFIKPYDIPKRFFPRITTGTYKGKKKGPYWCSEVVNFVNEWRYYVVNGTIIYAGWYQGHDDDQPPPQLNVDIPLGWCGCLDMGYLSTGEFALVEAGEPYSIGWYGRLTEGDIYSHFLNEGWNYLKERKW